MIFNDLSKKERLENIIDLWKADYENMQGTMIYGYSLPFGKLIEKIKLLNERINNIDLK
jgi:hypothetical protein